MEQLRRTLKNMVPGSDVPFFVERYQHVHRCAQQLGIKIRMRKEDQLGIAVWRLE